MQMVIARYITKEISLAFSAIVTILLFIFLSNKFVALLAKAASGKLPFMMLFKVIGLFIPEVFGFLAPIALFIAILFTHSRLHADSEIAVLLTSGYDWLSLTKVTLLVAVVLALLVGVISLGYAPMITKKREQVITDGQTVGIMHAITPGQIQMVDDNSDLVFYVEKVTGKGILQNVFIADNSNNLIISAKDARIEKLKDGNSFYLVLHNGNRYVGVPGQADYTVTKFAEYGRELKFPVSEISGSESAKPTKELIGSTNLAEQVELQWRVAMPMAVLVLALLAIPIAKVNPRQGRYAKVLPAILLYMMYFNALTVVKRWIAAGTLPLLPGLWLVHAVFVILALLLLLQVSGRMSQLLAPKGTSF